MDAILHKLSEVKFNELLDYKNNPDTEVAVKRLIDYLDSVNPRFKSLAFEHKLYAVYLIMTNKSEQIGLMHNIVYKQPVPTIDEFLTPEYIGGLSNYYTPDTKWGQELRSFFALDNTQYELIITGGIGIGKTFVGRVCLLYNLYCICCLTKPQLFMGTDPIAPIYMQAIGLALKSVDDTFMTPFKKLLDQCTRFKQVTKDKDLNVYHYDENTGKMLIPYLDCGNEIWFPNQVGIQRGSLIQHALSKDIFSCLVGDTVIPLMNGTFVKIKDLVGRTNFKVFSWDTKRNELAEGNAKQVKLTRKNADIYEVKFTNGGSVRITDNHLWLLKDNTYVETRNLKKGDLIKSIYLCKGTYIHVKTSNKQTHNGNKLLHRYLASKYLCEDYESKNLNCHHKDYNRYNNEVSNLEVLTSSEHARKHGYHKVETGEYSKIMEIQQKALNLNPNWKTDYPHVYEQRVKWGEDMRKRLKEKQDLRIENRNKEFPLEKIIECAKKYNTCDYNELSSILNCSKKHIIKLINNSFGNIYEFAEFFGLPQTQNTRRIRSLYENKGWMYTNPDNTPEKYGGKMKFDLSYEPNHEVLSIEYVGKEDVYDIEVDEYHNFAIADNLNFKELKSDEYSGFVYVHNCLLDEADFKSARSGVDALDFYKAMLGRIRSRFLSKGVYRTKYLLALIISSITSENGSINSYIKEVSDNKTITRIWSFAHWDIFPPRNSDGHFYAMSGTTANPSRNILNEEEIKMIDEGKLLPPAGCKFIKVPRTPENVHEFKTNITKALQDKAGIATSSGIQPFSDMSRCKNENLCPLITIKSNYDDTEPLWKQIPKEYYTKKFVQQEGEAPFFWNRYPNTPRHVGYDSAQTHIAGLAVAHKELSRTGTYKYVYDLLIEIVTDNQIKLDAVDQLIIDLNKIFGFRIASIALDTYQTAKSKQMLTAEFSKITSCPNIDIHYLSVDRTIEGYSILSSLIMEDKISWGKAERLEQQLGGISFEDNKPYANRDILGGRKDIADAVCRAGVDMHMNTMNIVPTEYYEDANKSEDNINLEDLGFELVNL